MRLVPHLSQEFEELCAHYAAVDQEGKDIVSLVKLFGDTYDHLRSEEDPDFVVAWETFLNEHKHQVTVMPMLGLVLHILVAYWDMGPMLYEALPTLEKMVLRDTIQEISDEIDRRSEVNGNAVAPE
jgi:hypothetical protein